MSLFPGYRLLWLARVARMIGRILLTLVVLTVSGFLILVLIGIWDRHEHQTEALVSEIFKQIFAAQVEFAEQSGGAEQPTPHQAPKLIGAGSAGSSNDGVPDALSADGSTAIVVGLGPTDAYRDRSRSGGPGALGFRGIYEGDFASRVDPAEQMGGREPVARHEGPKLIGTGAVGSANQGISVALSADGNTAIVGGPGPNNGDRDRSPSVGPAGAAWVFTRSSGVWTQQDKLVGTSDAYGGGLWSQGMSVAVSADGNTAIVGGPSDNRTTGAAWVFIRSGRAWTQQGIKLVGTSAHSAGQPILPSGQGISVALSGDGNTAVVGGWGTEAAWVFSRNGGVWTQGDKLVGSGAVGRARQGMSVALSADGNTAIVGGWSDNSKAGAAWVFVRSGKVWAQQGKKLVGTDAVGSARQGTSVALSADGNTAIVGGPGDNPLDRSVPFGLGAAGAAWVFTRSGGVWTQQGNKLVGIDAAGARQGTSVALSADGNTAVLGGFADDGGVVGWRASVFTRSDGHWKQENNLVGTGLVGNSAPSVALSDDGGTIIVGGSNDNGGVGAAWVFRRSGDRWTQDKYLVDTEAVNNSAPLVAPSAEGGNTMVGESNDSGRVGAAWISTISSAGSAHQEPPAASISSNPAWNWEE